PVHYVPDYRRTQAVSAEAVVLQSPRPGEPSKQFEEQGRHPGLSHSLHSFHKQGTAAAHAVDVPTRRTRGANCCQDWTMGTDRSPRAQIRARHDEGSFARSPLKNGCHLETDAMAWCRDSSRRTDS